MDLVDEQHVVLLKVRQDCGEVARALNCRTGRDAHRDAHLGSDDVGERRLAKAGRAIEEQVVERLVALLCRVHGDTEVVLELLLADELIEAAGPQGDIDCLFFVLRLAGDYALGGRSPASVECLWYWWRLSRACHGRSMRPSPPPQPRSLAPPRAPTSPAARRACGHPAAVAALLCRRRGTCGCARGPCLRCRAGSSGARARRARARKRLRDRLRASGSGRRSPPRRSRHGGM